MRIPIALVYRNFNTRGSIERDHVLVARGLAARGLEVHCFGLSARRDAHVEGIVHHDVPAVLLGRGRIGYALECATFARSATRELRRRRGDFLVVDVAGTDAWEQDVVTVHGVRRAGAERWLELAGSRVPLARFRSRVAPLATPRLLHVDRVERLQFRPFRALRAIARTDEVKADLERVHGVPSERIDVVNPPVAVERLAGAPDGWLRRSLGLDAGARLVLFVGRLTVEKGLGDLVDALAASDPRAQLVVLGRGDPQPFREAAARGGVSERVHFAGFVDEPERYLREADLLVFPSWRDVWGMPVVEGMAAGVAVVCTSASGVAPVVSGADAGLVVPAGAPSLREAIDALLADDARRAAMGRNGAAAARAFDVASHVDRVLATYAKTLEERTDLATSERTRQRFRTAALALSAMLG